jgi:MiaB/RimO family radical SAM methylthiotransferase
MANNLKPVRSSEKADLIVIFTCGAFAIDEESSILTLKESLQNGTAKVVVTGCLIGINPQRLKPYDNAITISPENMDRMDSLINANIPYAEIPNVSTLEDIHDLNRGSLIDRIKNRSAYRCMETNDGRKVKRSIELLFAPTTYKLEIAKGCLGNCNYCAIIKGNKVFHSFPEEQILASFKSGLKEGYKDFALIAQDIGCYGLDLKTNLPQLLSKLFSVEGDFRVLLWDLNVRWFIKYYLDFRSVLEENFEKVSMMILPIQSGSNRILGLMNRGYTIETAKECILDIQKRIPHLKLETHVIVGFPGETEEDFQKTVDLIREIPFFSVAIFKYEGRPNTKALDLPDKVTEKIISQRANFLAKEAKAIRERYFRIA